MVFDRIKAVAGLDTIIDFDEACFAQIKKDGDNMYQYYQKEPYLLSIKIDFAEEELVIEFTGKILGSDYPKLISKENIIQCFSNVNSLGIITLDIDQMMGAEVVTCDVTRDILFTDLEWLAKYIRNHMRNYERYLCRKYKNNNIVIEKNVVSPSCKKRMTVYDKSQEMQKAENRRFLEKYGLHNSFEGICRFEINLNSKQQIRNALGITNTRLLTVLSSELNPILDFLNECVEVGPFPDEKTKVKDYKNLLVLKDCDYDLEKVEAKMRQYYTSKGTRLKAVMKPYRDLLDKNCPNDICRWNHVCDLLAS